MIDLRKTIATSIKSADKSWFNEDYTKQAAQVMRDLRKAGYLIVPAEPGEKGIEAGLEAMTAGRHRPADVVSTIYRAMVAAEGR